MSPIAEFNKAIRKSFFLITVSVLGAGGIIYAVLWNAVPISSPLTREKEERVSAIMALAKSADSLKKWQMDVGGYVQASEKERRAVEIVLKSVELNPIGLVDISSVFDVGINFTRDYQYGRSIERPVFLRQDGGVVKLFCKVLFIDAYSLSAQIIDDEVASFKIPGPINYSISYEGLVSIASEAIQKMSLEQKVLVLSNIHTRMATTLNADPRKSINEAIDTAEKRMVSQISHFDWIVFVRGVAPLSLAFVFFGTFVTVFWYEIRNLNRAYQIKIAYSLAGVLESEAVFNSLMRAFLYPDKARMIDPRSAGTENAESKKLKPEG